MTTWSRWRDAVVELLVLRVAHCDGHAATSMIDGQWRGIKGVDQTHGSVEVDDLGERRNGVALEDLKRRWVEPRVECVALSEEDGLGDLDVTKGCERLREVVLGPVRWELVEVEHFGGHIEEVSTEEGEVGGVAGQLREWG